VLCSLNRAIGIISFAVAVSTGSPEALQAAWNAAKLEAKVAEAAERTRRAGQAANAAKAGACGSP
jgi:hypothetical protein